MHTVKMQNREIPVGKIIGIGRNYSAHAKELGNPIPDQPILFMKPASTIVNDGGKVAIPSFSDNCHHEVELAVLIGRGGKDIPPETAMDHVAGYAVALDLTLRDVQTTQKQKGLPWEIAKAFDTSCPLSSFVPADNVNDVQNLRLTLTVNNELRQDGVTADMSLSVQDLITVVSSYFTLEAGDIILTGTPAGVGPIKSGDCLEAKIAQVGSLKVTVS